MSYVSLLFWLAISLGCPKVNFQEKNNVQASKKVIVAEKKSDVIINGTRLRIRKKKTCYMIKDKELRDDIDFLNSNIKYYSIDKIIPKLLESQKYYQAILQNTHFLKFEANSFTKENSIFSLRKHNVKKYGQCYIGQYYFPTSANSGQTRVTVLINIPRREVSIWNFDNLHVSDNGLQCKFNTRGNRVIYKMVFSNTCNTFIPK